MKIIFISKLIDQCTDDNFRSSIRTFHQRHLSAAHKVYLTI
jgi:hypothetical protein